MPKNEEDFTPHFSRIMTDEVWQQEGRKWLRSTAFDLMEAAARIEPVTEPARYKRESYIVQARLLFELADKPAEALDMMRADLAQEAPDAQEEIANVEPGVIERLWSAWRGPRSPRK